MGWNLSCQWLKVKSACRGYLSNTVKLECPDNQCVLSVQPVLATQAAPEVQAVLEVEAAQQVKAGPQIQAVSSV